MVDKLDELSLKAYFNLDMKIQELAKQKKFLHSSFYLQNMATRTIYDELGVRCKGFKQEEELEDLFSAMEALNRRIERNLFRERHFKKYLEQLPYEDVKSLISKYRGHFLVEPKSSVVDEVMEEIQEIETALCFREGLEVPVEKVDLTQDLFECMDIIAGVAI